MHALEFLGGGGVGVGEPEGGGVGGEEFVGDDEDLRAMASGGVSKGPQVVETGEDVGDKGGRHLRVNDDFQDVEVLN